MAKRIKKQSKSALKLETLETRQLLAGVTGAGTEVTPGGTGVQGDVAHFIQHPNGNKYDQVLLTGGSVSITNDAGQITRVSFLDLQGDIVQAEFSGTGTFTVSMADGYTTDVAPANYNQSGVKYVQGLATITVSGSDTSSNINVFSVGSGTAFAGNTLFDATHTGGDHTSDIQRITIVADPSNPNGSTFGSITAGNTKFGGSSGVVGITAANVQVQGLVRLSDIKASGSATPTLIFGTASQFGDVQVTGGDLVSPNARSINNNGSYAFGVSFIDGTKSDGTLDAKESISPNLTFTGANPLAQINKTITLTSGVDNGIGGDGNDTFNAGTLDVSAFDTISGGNGSDTLNITNVSGTLSVNTTTATSVTGIELVNIQNSANAVTADLSGMDSALQKVVLNNTVDTGVTLTTKSNATEAIISGADSVTITDSGTTDKLATVSLSGANLNNASTITSDALTTLNLTTTGAGISVTAASGTRTLTVNTNGVTAGSLTDAQATTLNITNSSANSALGTVTVAKATSVTIDNGGKDVTLAGLVAGDAKTVTLKGSGKNTLSATTLGKLETLDASGSSSDVSITGTLVAGAAYTGSSGKDTVSIGATTKAISTGSGDDSVTVTVGALGTGGTIDAGAGTDTLTMAGTDAITATATAAFGDAISNFEKVTLTGATAGTIDLSKLDSLASITFTGDAAGTTLNKVVNDSTVTLNAAQTGTVTVTMADAAGSSDSLNLALGGTSATATAYGTISAAGVETVKIATDDTNSSPAGATPLTATLVDAVAKSITVSGDAALSLTFTGTALTSLDASGISKGGLTYTSGNLGAAATIKGGAGADTINVNAATTAAVTVIAGDGANTISATNGMNNTITAGKDADSITTGTGNDTITAGDGANVINAGAGNNSVTTGKDADSITTGAGIDTINAGDGADTISSGAGLDVITGGAGADTFVITTAGTNKTSYATITDAAAGDKIQFATNMGTEVLGAKISLADTTPFDNYLDAAAAGDGSTNGIINWFQYGGNTYVVYDVSAGATFVDGTDTVVKLSGLVDLSTGPSTVTAGTGGAPLLTIV